MIAKSGDRLLAEEAVAAIRDALIPLAEVITPNLPEAAALLGRQEPADLATMRIMAADLLRFGSQAVLLKGGHLPSPDATDVLADSDGRQEFTAPRVATKNTHGTGCTLSSAIAALLPVMPRADAVRAAKAYLTEALKHADDLTVGHGHGPVRHFP
jgi:hydroxymethylpyrimidine/phosphomethylpyrimidine kinase